MSRSETAPREPSPVTTVVLATSAPFWPPWQGDSARVAALVEYLADEGWRVHVVHLRAQTETDPDYEAMRRRCASLEVYVASSTEKAQQVDSDRCDDWCPEGFAQLVADRCAAVGASAVIAQFVYLSRCLLRLPPGVLRVLDADNVFAGRRETFARAGLGYWWFSTDAAEEARCLRRADVLLAIQPREARLLAETSGLPVSVVPHGVRSRQCPPAEGESMLYVGSSSPANIEAIRRFAADSMPVIRARVPTAELIVCGDVARYATEAPGVRRVGTESDLRRWYDRAAVVINPAPAGTGLSIKTVEALAHGKCLVTTRAGAIGVPDIERAARVVPTASDMAGAVADLLGQPERVHEMERAAAALAARHFAPRAAFAPLHRLLAAHVGAGSRIRRPGEES